MIKEDVCEAVLDFFHHGKMLKQWNCTTITLVPKVQNPSYAKEFWPIACCTTAYKIISKIITGRLAKVIGEVIDEAGGSILGIIFCLLQSLLRVILISFFLLDVLSRLI